MSAGKQTAQTNSPLQTHTCMLVDVNYPEHSVNTTLAGMFVPMVSASPVGHFNPVAVRTALSVLMVGLPRVESVRYKVSRERCAFSALVDMPPRASTTFLRAVR